MEGDRGMEGQGSPTPNQHEPREAESLGPSSPGCPGILKPSSLRISSLTLLVGVPTLIC